MLDSGEHSVECNLATIVESRGFRVFALKLLSDVLVLNGKGSALCDILIQRFEALLVVLQVLGYPNEFLHCLDIKKLVNILVMPEKIGGNVS